VGVVTSPHRNSCCLPTSATTASIIARVPDMSGSSRMRWWWSRYWNHAVFKLVSSVAAGILHAPRGICLRAAALG
jgi:hypothetical protein